MKQSNSGKNRAKTIALYLRISREEQGKDESYSIANQRKLLQRVAKEKGFTKFIEFADDGITGTKRDRKDFIKMLAELEKGHISALIVKDLSRLARDHIQADTLLEEFFPEHDIRFIAVSEGIDTANGEDEFAPFRNLVNEWYSRDISKKRKLTNVVKGNAGEPLSPPPYGYRKDPDNPKRWLIDEEAAAVVRRIYQMTLDGYGTEQIASALTQDRILIPVFYWKSKGINRPGRMRDDKVPHEWNSSTIVKMLSMQEYCGDVINFKTYAKSFKLKKRLPNDEANMAVFKDVHAPIIDRATWEKVQAKRGKARKRKTNEGEKNMFSGLLVCADCGHNLWYHFSQKNNAIKYFNCSNYKGNPNGTCPTTHYVRVDFLEQVILQEIRCLTKFASKYEQEFAKAVMGHSRQTVERKRQQNQKELRALAARDRELDQIFSRMYEDNIAGKIDDDRFERMSGQYAAEQAELAEKVKVLRAELEKQNDEAKTVELFLATVRKYTRARKLSERMLNELIERIEVHQAEKIDGEHQQKFTIHYHFIGALELPNLVALPENEIRMETRKGVAISYSHSQKVV